MEVNNMAALRKALKYAREVLALNGFVEPTNRCDAALAKPARNCDVGTADEQHARFVAYCDRCDCPMGCDHRKNFVGVLSPECSSILKCFARWAQMPYEAEGGAE